MIRISNQNMKVKRLHNDFSFKKKNKNIDFLGRAN